MITDVHTHIWETPDQLGRGAAKHIRRHVEQPWDRPDASISAHEAAMQPVQAVLVHGFESRHLGASVPAKQVANHVARNPQKYIGFAGVDPLGDYRTQIAQARQLGLVGVTICPAGQGCHPSHSRAMKVYQLCVDHGMPVFVHPATHLGRDAKMEFAQPFLFDEIAREFPTLRICIGQIGYPWIDQGLTLIGKHDHVYAELSNVVSRPWQLYNTLLTAHQLGVTNHLLFGSDYPFCTPEKAITTIYSVNTLTQGTPLPSVPREKLRSIVERDVLACLGLKDVTRQSADSETETEGDAAAIATALATTVSGNGRHASRSEKTNSVGSAATERESESPSVPTTSEPANTAGDAGDKASPTKSTSVPAEPCTDAVIDSDNNTGTHNDNDTNNAAESPATTPKVVDSTEVSSSGTQAEPESMTGDTVEGKVDTAASPVSTDVPPRSDASDPATPPPIPPEDHAVPADSGGEPDTGSAKADDESAAAKTEDHSSVDAGATTSPAKPSEPRDGGENQNLADPSEAATDEPAKTSADAAGNSGHEESKASSPKKENDA